MTVRFPGSLLAGKSESSTLRQRLLAGVTGLLGLRVAFSALSFGGTILLARLLGPENFGAYSFSLAWVVLLAIPSLLGMDQLLVREVAANRAKGQWDLLHGLLRRANSWVFLTSSGVALGAAATGWFLIGHSQPRLFLTFLATLPFLPLINLTRLRQASMQGLHQVVLGALPEQLIQPALLVAFLAAASVSHYALGAPIAMTANVIAAAVAFAVGWRMLYRSLPAEVMQATPVYRDRLWAGSALPLVFLAGASALFGQADTLILGSLKGAAAVGVYSVAHKSSELIGMILIAANSAFASTVASLYAVGDRIRLQRLITRLARLLFLASLPIAISLMVFSRPFLLLYGPHFAQAKLTLAILSFGQLGNLSTGCVGLLLVMTGHERQVAIAIGAGAIANVVLSFVLAPRWGAEGVAVAYAASMILWNVWAAIALYRKTGLDSTILGQGSVI